MKVFLTGATGFLAGEILMLLSKRKDVKKIFCLIRANSAEEAGHKLRGVFNLHGDHFDKNKVVPVLGNLLDNKLAEKLRDNELLADVNVVIHAAANTSFSRAHDHLVEKVNIGGTQQILDWAKNLARLKTFTYVGTATICGKDVRNRLVREDESPRADAKQLVKYAYTKLIGELSVRAVIPAEKLLIVRPSIIMGDSRSCIPRSYVIMWAVAAFNTIRLLPVNAQADLDIIPVDYAARSIVELVFAKHRRYSTYHISAGEKGKTNLALLMKAIEAQKDQELPAVKFISHGQIEEMRLWTRGKLAPNDTFEIKNAAHLRHIARTLDGNGNLRILLVALDAYFKFVELGQVFDNTRLIQDTTVGQSEPAHAYMERNRAHVTNIDVLQGALDP